jgi:hypothetical protein
MSTEPTGSGGFAVDGQAGARLVETLDAVAAALEREAGRSAVIGGEPPLGATPAGRFVAARLTATATDDRGLLTQLGRARAEFPRYVEAIESAAAHYHEREHTTHDTIGRLEPED